MREHLIEIMNAALAKVKTADAVKRHLPEKPVGKCIIIGAGKASAEMAAAVEDAWSDVTLIGLVSTRYGHAVPTKRIQVLEAGHPIPDENSLKAGEEILRLLDGLSEDDLVLALISGGGSATLEVPIEGLTLEGLQIVTKHLLGSGASISEINTVRQSLSQIKGGKLAAAAYPAKLVSLVISDVPGDDLSLVASGPTIAPTPFDESASAILKRLGIHVPNAAARDTEPKNVPDEYGSAIAIASNGTALRAAEESAIALGYQTTNLGDDLQGESAELGKRTADMAAALLSETNKQSTAHTIISGGETTVTLSNEIEAGSGGPNQEFLLSFASHIDCSRGVWGLAIDTDGYDGFVDAAGAIFTPDTNSRAQSLGMDPAQYLSSHDSFTFFEALGDVVHTGPTQTNVNDLRIIIIGEPTP